MLVESLRARFAFLKYIFTGSVLFVRQVEGIMKSCFWIAFALFLYDKNMQNTQPYK